MAALRGVPPLLLRLVAAVAGGGDGRWMAVGARWAHCIAHCMR